MKKIMLYSVFLILAGNASLRGMEVVWRGLWHETKKAHEQEHSKVSLAAHPDSYTWPLYLQEDKAEDDTIPYSDRTSDR